MDSSGEQLHPNWRALTTIHLPLKRFIPEGIIELETARDSTKYHVESGTGTEVKTFYEQIVAAPSNSQNTQKVQDVQRFKSQMVVKQKKTPFDCTKYFRYAMENRAHELQQFDYKTDEQLNTTDSFGWTALMMAACEGAAEALSVLLDLGVDKYMKDSSGKTALDLARKKGHAHIVSLLQSNSAKPQEKEEASPMPQSMEPFYCNDCKRTFNATTRREHQTSTVHQFNVKSSLPPNKLQKFNIPPQNKGLQLMVKQGWDKESGLGPEQHGRLYPVKTVIRKQRTGLGIEQTPARVTHFEAFDLRATQRHSSDYYKRKPRTRNDMRSEKRREWKRERRLRRELN